MKIIWEAKDIKAGIVVGKSIQSERWKIGYMANRNSDEWVLISMIDGMVQPPVSAKTLAHFLTTNNAVHAVLLDS